MVAIETRRVLTLSGIATLTALTVALWQTGTFSRIAENVETWVDAMTGTDLTEEECKRVEDDRMINSNKIKGLERYRTFVTDPDVLNRIDEEIRGLREKIAEQNKVIAECHAQFPHLKPN